MARHNLRLDRTRIELRLRQVWSIARGSSVSRTNVLTRLSCAGISGLGEAAPNARYGEDAASVLRSLDLIAPLLGDDATQHDAILRRIETALPGCPAARAAIDIALHDWTAKKDGVPLWRAFGADPARAPATSMSIGIDTIALMQEKARQASGFRVLKVKVDRANARAIVEGIRRVTDKPLYVDANEAWTDPRMAAEVVRWMGGMGVALVEQPLPASDLDGAKYVRDRVDMPMIADEAALTAEDIDPLAQAYDGVNVKVQKAGGLCGALRMIEKARSCGMTIMLGCMIETSLGITAAAHLSPLVDHADLDGNLLIADDPFRGALVRDGRLVLPEGPGIGIEGDFWGA